MNLWSMLRTTDFTSDKPKMAQNNVLKLSSILEKQRWKMRVQLCSAMSISVCQSVPHRFEDLLFLKVLQGNKIITTICCWYSRCKSIVVFGSQVVWVQIKHSHHESHKNCYENHHELKDVFYCSSQRDLQRPKALIGWQNICNARETQHNCNCIEAFRNELWVWGHPVDSSWKKNNKCDRFH